MEKQQEQFDNHLFVLFSIIIGLALTDFLEGIALLILNWERVEFYWVHTFSAIVVFLFSLQFWWGLWKYQSINWSFVNLLLFLGICSTIFLLNKMIFPDILPGQSIISLKDHYFDIRAPFWFTYLGWGILTLARSITILKRSTLARQNIMYVIAIGAALTLAINAEESTHVTLTIVGLIVMIISVGWMFSHPKMETLPN